MEDYHWAMFTHAMDFFQEWASLRKTDSKKNKITILLKDVLTKDLVTLFQQNIWNVVDSVMPLQANELGCHKILGTK